jgi:hypothetical protein
MLTAVMRPSDVSLGERALSLCGRLGIPETDLRTARCGTVSTHEGAQYLIVIGDLPDGRSVRMLCRHDRPNHIVTFRPLP